MGGLQLSASWPWVTEGREILPWERGSLREEGWALCWLVPYDRRAHGSICYLSDQLTLGQGALSSWPAGPLRHQSIVKYRK